MKIRILLALIILSIAGIICYTARLKNAQEVESSCIKEAVEFEYKNHSYILFATGPFGKYNSGVVHNPSCQNEAHR